MIPQNTATQAKGNSTKSTVLEILEFWKSQSKNSTEKHFWRGIIHGVQCGKYEFKLETPDTTQDTKEYDPMLECEKDLYRNPMRDMRKKRNTVKSEKAYRNYTHRRMIRESYAIGRSRLRELHLVYKHE